MVVRDEELPKSEEGSQVIKLIVVSSGNNGEKPFLVCRLMNDKQGDMQDNDNLFINLSDNY